MSPRIAAGAGLVVLPMVVLILTGIWTGDDRWGATAGTLFAALVIVTVATITISEIYEGEDDE